MTQNIKKKRDLKSLIASLYADHLKKNSFKITIDENGRLLCDGLPQDLEPLVAGWLLRDLFVSMEPEKIERGFQFRGEFEAGPILNNNGSQNGFACIWAQMGGGFLQSDMISDYYAYFDFSKKDRFQEKFLSLLPDLPIFLNNSAQCALSEEGRYLLVIYGGTSTFTNTVQKPAAYLYDLFKLKEDNLPDKTFPLERSMDEIVTVLFDKKAHRFNIIAYSKNAPSALGVEKNFWRYIIALDSMDLKTQKDFISVESKKVKWSCINGKLIGIHPDGDIIVHNGEELKACHFDKKKNGWFYKEGAEDKPLDFCVIKTKEKSKSQPSISIDVTVAVQDSFMPDFQEFITERLKDTIVCDELKFDANHYCNYFITHDKAKRVGILYPGKERFIKALTILNKRWAAGDPRVLIDAFCIDRLERNPESWEVDCKHILEPRILISEDIQKIYKIDQLLKQLKESRELKSLGWTQALKQGKLFAYAQHRWQLFYSHYKKPLLGGIAVGGVGIAALYLNKYAKNNWWSSAGMQKQIPAPRPMQPQ